MRNEAIDILKGIGITLVLVAHSLGGFVSQFAYTFHMPLFFLVAGLFIAETDGTSFGTWWNRIARKDFKRLLLPAFFTLALLFAVCGVWYLYDASRLHPLALIWNENPDRPLASIVMPGNLWFLFAMFFAKQAFYLVRQVASVKLLPWCCLIFGGLAAWTGQYIYLPFCILVSVSVLPFIGGGIG